MRLLYKTAKRGRWLTVRDRALKRLNDTGHVTADAISEFPTRGDTLSVFEVDEPANAARILAAIACGRTELDNTDYLLFDDGTLKAVGLKLVKSLGKTPDHAVNGWHFDVSELTADKLASLAEELVIASELREAYRPDLIEGIQSAALAGQLELTLIPDKIKKQAKL